MGYGLVAPILPLVVSRYGLSNTGASLLLASYAAGRILVALPSGWLTNRYGFRPVAVGCSAITGTAALIAAVDSTHFVVLVGSQFVQGMATGVLTTAGLTTVIGLADGANVARLVSIYHGLILAVMLFAPTVGGAAAALIGIPGPFVVAAGAGLLGLVLAIGFVNTELLAARSGEIERRQARRAALREVILSRPFVTTFVSSFGMIWALAGVRNTLLPLFTDAVLGFSSVAIGATLTAATVGALLALIPSGRLIDHWGRRPVVRTGTAAMAIGTAGLALASTVWVVIPLALLIEGARSSLSPIQSAVISDIAGESTRASAIGISRLSNALGSATGPVMAGWFVDTGGPRNAFWLAAGFLGLIALISRAMPETGLARRGQ